MNDDEVKQRVDAYETEHRRRIESEYRARLERMVGCVIAGGASWSGAIERARGLLVAIDATEVPQ